MNSSPQKPPYYRLVKTLENLIIAQLIPAHSWLQPSKFPDAIDLTVVVFIRSMAVTAQLDSLQFFSLIDLVGRAQLMVADNLSVGYLLPPCLTKQMLGLDGFVTQEAGVGDHGHVLIGGHAVPFCQPDLGVVDLQGWGNDAAQAVPVLKHR